MYISKFQACKIAENVTIATYLTIMLIGPCQKVATFTSAESYFYNYTEGCPAVDRLVTPYNESHW
jgi:hypothetical protein